MSGTAQGPASPLPVPAGASAAVVPEWVHLLPAGAIIGRDGRSFRMTNAAGVIAASLRYAAAKPLPIDYGHQIDLTAKTGGEAPAAGWITTLQARRDGIWGRVQWTPRARAALAAREYRFLSPVLMHRPDGEVAMLLRAALTNNPNLSQLTALNATGTPMDLEQMLAHLREMLGLPATADAQAVMTEVRNLVTARNTPDPAQFVPIALFQQAVTEAQKANAGLSLNAAERVVDEAIRDRRLMPWMREWGVSLCGVNAPAFQKFIEGVGPSLNSFLGSLEKPAFPAHRWTTPPDGEKAGAPNEIAQRLGLTAEDLAKYGK